MMRKRSKTLKMRTLRRDNFTCQKCKVQGKTRRILEAHHIIPISMDGKDEIDNVITLCFDCHKFAPNTRKEFDEYMGEEMDGILTTLIKAWNKVRKEHPELFEQDKHFQNESRNRKIKRRE